MVKAEDGSVRAERVSQTVIHGDRGRDSLVPNSIFRRSSFWFKSGSNSGFERKIDRRIGGRRLRRAHYKTTTRWVLKDYLVEGPTIYIPIITDSQAPFQSNKL